MEKNGYMFAREGGKWLAQQFNGLQIQMFIDHYTSRLTAARSGCLTAQSGEFIVADVPSNTIHSLVTAHRASRLYTRRCDQRNRNLAEINRAVVRSSRDYFFAPRLIESPGLDGGLAVVIGPRLHYRRCDPPLHYPSRFRRHRCNLAARLRQLRGGRRGQRRAVHSGCRPRSWTGSRLCAGQERVTPK